MTRTTPSQAYARRPTTSIWLIKQGFGLAKMRYRGSGKNTYRRWVTWALVNLFIVWWRLMST